MSWLKLKYHFADLARRLAAAATVVLVLFIACPSHAQPSATPEKPVRIQPATVPFADFVGINVKFGQGEPAKDLPLLKELGVHWVRDAVDWQTIEPAPGRYLTEFPKDFRDRLAYYKANDIGVDFLLCYTNPVAFPDSPDKPHNSMNPEAFGRFAVVAAKLLKASGVRFVLEIWNEPHNFMFEKAYGGNWQGAAPSPWVDAYVNLVAETVADVKAFDPRIRLFDDDDMWIVHYWFLQAGLPKALDGFSFHPYGGPWPERTAVDWDTDWCRPFQVVDKDGSFRSAVRRLREQGELKMGRTPQMWITEWGWAMGDKTPNGPVNEKILSGYVPRAFISAWTSGVKAMTWFSLYDGPDGPIGLTKNDGTKRLSFGAFRTMSRELGASTAVWQVAGVDHLTTGVQAFLFRSPSGYKLAAWTIDANPAGANVTLTDKRAKTDLSPEDVQGNPIPLTKSGPGQWTLRLTSDPIYISGVDSDAAIQP